MDRLVPKEKWVPKGVKELERIALDVVRSTENALVIAGPGAGKTELLAQRACYLLETGLCAEPKRILAISFKKDAAKNLADRVAKRVGPELSKRFDSLTFDAFAKGLVDRFRLGIPEFFRPSSDYVLDFALSKGKGHPNFRRVMEEVIGHAKSLTSDAVRQSRPTDIYKDYFVGDSLVYPHSKGRPFELTLALYAWRQLLRAGKKSTLNFEMLGRLADLMLRHNPAVIKGLRTTYAYVFLDEFQDTSSIHYDLTRTAFQGSQSVLTSVGDEKQRIMAWAGALNGVFKRFKEDFKAKPHGLKMNYRSAPELVRVQSYLINALEPDGTPPQAVTDGSKGEGECRVLSFEDHELEAWYLADLVHKVITEDQVAPRDICILTRNYASKYSAYMVSELEKLGVVARVEDQFQDLLAEPVVEAVLHFLKLIVNKRAPESWEYIVGLWAMATGNALDNDVFLRDAEKNIMAFRSAAKHELKSVDSEKALKDLVVKCVLFFGRRSFKTMFPQYQQGTYLKDIVLHLVVNLFGSWSKTRGWKEAFDDFEGLNSVPIMTIHKSKGLEYHTVIFIGLEDSALWGFKDSQNEETCAFFVALSRAKSRVIFTFCHQRPDARNGKLDVQSRKTIDPLYQVLLDAGIESEEIIRE